MVDPKGSLLGGVLPNGRVLRKGNLAFVWTPEEHRYFVFLCIRGEMR